MVTLNLIDSATVIQIVLLVMALGLSFLALRTSPFLWFIVMFVWVGLSYECGQVDNSWGGVGAGGMAFVSIAMFVLSVGKSGRRGRG
jgi:hypothetical protein